ncbi:MAG: hypothetical protein P1V18_03265 [Candidatus Gracilibacteria bacterium]|nr:hypothetical protein [Candidatus Gracilibacteria bacterium]
MFFTENQELDEKIIVYLSKNHQATVKEMMACIHFKHRPTLQGFYKRLRQLISSGVVIKQKTTYFLNQNWAMSMTDLGQQLFSSVSKNDHILQQIISTGKQTFHFYDLANLDYFWTHIYLQIVKQSGKKTDIYSYNPNSWYFIVHPVEEEQVLRNLKKDGAQLHLVLGEVNTVNKEALKWHQKFGAKVCFSTDVFTKKQMINYYNCIGDFLIEIKINPVVASRIRQLFEDGKNPTPEETLAITFLRARHTITFHYRSKKQSSLEKKLRECF